MRDILTLVQEVGQLETKAGHSAPDISHFVPLGVPGIGLYTFGEQYFDYHHTHADTVDKVDPVELTQSAAAMAAVAWVIAEMPERFGTLP